MEFPWGFCEQEANREPLLRYDQWTFDPEQRAEALRAAAQLVKEATARKLKLNVVTSTLKPEPSWCEQITATITVGNDRDAGRIFGYQISRKDLRRNSKPFHYYLDIPSEGACNVANAVFDRLGRLKKHLYGNFKAETDQGDLLYVRDIKIKPHLRKKGLACFALKLLLQQLSQRHADGEQNEEVWSGRWWFAVMHREECEDSWRSAGFRVLDRTRFLACCAMRGHKCWDHTESDPPPLDDDVQLPKRALDKALMHLVQSKMDSSGPTKQSLYAKADRLLAAGADFETSMAVQFAAISIQRAFLGWLLSHGADINQQDSAGNTALHFAAHSGQAQFLDELLEMKANPLLKTTAGFTPMDVCILEMQFQREYRDACLDGFKGHDAKYMAVIRRLQNTGPKLERLTCLPVPKNKWGCTCGGCLNGHLSPRMHFRLKTLALSINADGLADLGDVDYPADLIEHADPDIWLYHYLPFSLCRKMPRKFAVGWFRLFGIIYTSLNSDTVPTATQVIRGIAETPKEIYSCIKFYLDQGGKVEYALDALIGQSRRENEILGDVVGAYDMEQLRKLIKCENDDDYTFLLRQLCHNDFMPSGPYFDDHDVRSKIAHEMSHMSRPLYSIPPDDGKYD